jgi:Spy/CpxP family protein refolding chaperone
MSYLKNHKLLLVIISVLLIANIGLLYYFVFNKPRPPVKPTQEQMRARAKEKVKSEVGFNDEQAAKYDTLRTAQFEKMKPLFEDLTKSKEDLFNLISQSGVSDSVIQNYANAIGEKQKAIDLNTFEYFQSIKALCTEEQKPKMDSFIQQIVKRIINNNGRRGGGPDRKDKSK